MQRMSPRLRSWLFDVLTGSRMRMPGLPHRGNRHGGTGLQGTRFERAVRLVVRGDVHGGEVAVRKTEDKAADEHRDDLRALAEAVTKKPTRTSSIDEMSLETHRRAIAYGRARGNS